MILNYETVIPIQVQGNIAISMLALTEMQVLVSTIMDAFNYGGGKIKKSSYMTPRFV